MLEAAALLPAQNDIEVLREHVLAQEQSIAERDALIDTRNRELVYKETKIAALMHELARYKRWLFAARSEKLDPAQRVLFEDLAAFRIMPAGE